MSQPDLTKARLAGRLSSALGVIEKARPDLAALWLATKKGTPERQACAEAERSLNEGFNALCSIAVALELDL